MYSTRVECLNKLRQVIPSMAQPGAASPPLLGRAFISGPSFRAWYGPSGPDVPITQLSYDHSQAFVRLTPLARSAWSAHPGGREVLNRPGYV